MIVGHPRIVGEWPPQRQNEIHSTVKLARRLFIRARTDD